MNERNITIDTQVNIIDMPMGSGKSTAMMNYINDDDSDMHYLYVTPLISEQERVVNYCAWKRMQMPIERYSRDTKIKCLKDMLSEKQNIVTTHAMFQRFDEEMINLCREGNYTLVLDEVANVIEEYSITPHDLRSLLTTYTYKDENDMLIWRKEQEDYTGKFNEEKQLCDHYSLAHHKDHALFAMLPVDYFNAFKRVFILTYMFDAQIQKYYYDFFHIKYNYIYVECDSPFHYALTTKRTNMQTKYDYKNLIHIWDNRKVNKLCKDRYDLSMMWLRKHAHDSEVTQLKNNMTNFVKNVCKVKSADVLWTTFMDYKKTLSAKGYTKSFLYHTARATNEYRDRTCVIYAVNKFMNPFVRNFFVDHGVHVNEDRYALSEMLQFIWRSAIRDGHEINVYIPSKRMRDLLVEWINENSI